eukprot:SAG31_NODE_180_length_21118_cov_62.152671_4_plen_92_part_00
MGPRVLLVLIPALGKVPKVPNGVGHGVGRWGRHAACTTVLPTQDRCTGLARGRGGGGGGQEGHQVQRRRGGRRRVTWQSSARNPEKEYFLK